MKPNFHFDFSIQEVRACIISIASLSIQTKLDSKTLGIIIQPFGISTVSVYSSSFSTIYYDARMISSIKGCRRARRPPNSPLVNRMTRTSKKGRGGDFLNLAENKVWSPTQLSEVVSIQCALDNATRSASCMWSYQKWPSGIENHRLAPLPSVLYCSFHKSSILIHSSISLQ